jgi:hypothetical protein
VRFLAVLNRRCAGRRSQSEADIDGKTNFEAPIVDLPKLPAVPDRINTMWASRNTQALEEAVEAIAAAAGLPQIGRDDDALPIVP